MQKVIMVASWDWTLDKFRLALAEFLRKKGYDITFVCANGQYVKGFQERGFRWIEWESKRKRLNPIAELRALWSLAEIYRKEQPDLIHHDTLKPNLYGPLAIKLNQLLGRVKESPKVINTFMGLGYVFSEGFIPMLIRTLITPFLRFGINQPNVHVVFSNAEDQNRLRSRGILKHDRTAVLMSEFVDTEKFRPTTSDQHNQKDAVECKNEIPVILMAVRLLWAKGVSEFAEAARILKEGGIEACFWLAGEPDKDSAGFVPEKKLYEWEEEGLINWLGYQTDMPALLNQADIAVLPTKYNEGMPRFLVEAIACGLPVVATDMEACRIVVRGGENGIIVPPGNAERLADALERLVTNEVLRSEMGKAAREIAVEEFDEGTGVEAWHHLYARHLE
jgi:glycosyltransferase involved in cell wall biosynthesis